MKKNVFISIVVKEKKVKYKHCLLRSTVHPEISMKCHSSSFGGTLEYGELCEEIKLINQGITFLFAGRSLIGMKRKLNQTCGILCALGYEKKLFEMIKNGLLQYLNRRIRRLVYIHPPFYECNAIGEFQACLNEWNRFVADFNNVLLCVERILFPVTRMVIKSSESVLLRNVAFDFIKDLLKTKKVMRKFAQQCIELTVVWGFQRYWYHLSLNELPKLLLVFDFMRELEVYTWMIEPCILKFCTSFYQDVVQKWMHSHQQYSPLEYINQLQKWTNCETKAFITCLSQKTYKKWREIRRKITFQNQLSYLFSMDESLKKNVNQSQFISCFLIFNQSDFLQKLYIECHETETLESFYQYYENCVEKQVEEILNLFFGPSTMSFHHYFYLPLFNCSYYPIVLHSFGYLIDFQKNLQWGLANLLQNDSHIIQLTYLAWSKAVNKNEHIQEKVSRYVADFVHFLLTRTNMRPETVSKELESGMNVLNYLQSPSLFQVYYTIDFKRRVLLDCRFVLALEKEMVAFLSQVEYNDTFSKKILGVLNTVEESVQINKTFESHCVSLREKSLLSFEFHLSLLPLPLYCDVWGHAELLRDKTVPGQINHSPFFLLQNTFKTFYELQFKDRKLYWEMHSGTCDVVISVQSQGECIQYYCQMTEIQALCLLLFNNKPSYELEEIISLTGCEPKLISQHLECMCHPESLLLRKTNRNNIVYTWNEEFRTREPYLSFLQDSFYAKVTTNTFESCAKQDSSYYIDALIMRIMKNQKRLSYSCLVNCIKEKVQRDIPESFLAQRLQVLVDQAFLNKNMETSNFYTYCTHNL